ncbi:MAG: type III pantothenate kinase [Bacteroidota bacterium]|nr:type III pantothenate kinase [Bacteroidota bacterium]
MLLTIDAGNTHSVFGFFLKGKLLFDRRMTSSPSRTEDEFWLHIKHFCDQMKITPEGIQGVAIASVVPELTDVFTKMTKRYLKLQPTIINGTLDIGITINYDDPKKLGADRICNIVAAHKKFGGPTIIADFGTATTYDVVSNKGEYLGGVIAPGLETAAQELYKRTAKLPKTDLQFPDSILGKNTVTAIQSGVMYGAVDAAEGMIRRLRKLVGKYATVVATGGYAGIVAEMSNEIKYIEPNLVLEGARLIYERVSKKAKK